MAASLDGPAAFGEKIRDCLESFNPFGGHGHDSRETALIRSDRVNAHASDFFRDEVKSSAWGPLTGPAGRAYGR